MSIRKKELKKRYKDFDLNKLKNYWHQKINQKYMNNVPYQTIENFFCFLNNQYDFLKNSSIMEFIEEVLVHSYFECLPIDSIDQITIIGEVFLIKQFIEKKNWKKLILDDYTYQKCLFNLWFTEISKKIKK